MEGKSMYLDAHLAAAWSVIFKNLEQMDKELAALEKAGNYHADYMRGLRVVVEYAPTEVYTVAMDGTIAVLSGPEDQTEK